MGDFNTDTFGSGGQVALVYLFFGLATFFSIILMLNMLIAIMGDTYEKIIENRDVNEVKTLLSLMGEQATNIQVLVLCQKITRLAREGHMRWMDHIHRHRGEPVFTQWNWYNAIPFFFFNGILEALGWVDDSHNEHFLFLITPDEVDESDVESWEGSIKRMSRLSSQHMEEIKTTLDAKIESLWGFIETNFKRDVT